ncbi:MAG: CRISPR-associated protein Cas4 [Armatimonadota bacterium]
MAAPTSRLELTVSDIKQFLYCARIPFHRYVTRAPAVPTAKMTFGKEAHARTDRLERRRTLAEFELLEGEREFHVPLRSDRLGLTGTLDMLIRAPREVIPVEFKDSVDPPGLNHKYQLVAYALLVEEHFDCIVRRGYIHLIPAKEVIEYAITPNMRRHVLRTLAEMRRVLASERLPAPPANLGKCTDCEYRRFCNDIW